MAMVNFTRQIAIQNADSGVRINTMLPGLMDTPMAVDRRMKATDRTRDDVAAERDAKILLLNKMGTGWDVANAALSPVSDERGFNTVVELSVDGGSMARVGWTYFDSLPLVCFTAPSIRKLENFHEVRLADSLSFPVA